MKVNSISRYNSKNYGNVNFGVKIPAVNVMQIATGRLLPGTKGIQDVVNTLGQMIGQRISPYEIPTFDSQCRKAIFKQFPMFEELASNLSKNLEGLSDSQAEKHLESFTQRIRAWNDVDFTPIKPRYNNKNTPFDNFLKQLNAAWKFLIGAD